MAVGEALLQVSKLGSESLVFMQILRGQALVTPPDRRDREYDSTIAKPRYILGPSSRLRPTIWDVISSIFIEYLELILLITDSDKDWSDDNTK